MPPANDNFASRITLSGGSGSWSGTNVGATIEAGEPDPLVGSPGTTIWFEWTCPATGRYEWDTYGSGVDTVLDILQGASLAALTTVAANDDSVFGYHGGQSDVHVDLIFGQVYYIRVGGYAGATGSIILNWDSFVAPTRPADPSSAQIQLLDGHSMRGVRYIGRWVLNIPAIPSAPGDGNIGEYDFVIYTPSLTQVAFSIDTDFYLANHFAAGLILDTDDTEWWVDGAGTYDGGGTQPDNAFVWDGIFAGPFDLGYAITVDETNSDPDWWRATAGPTITSITPDAGGSGDSVVIIGTGFTDASNVAFAGPWNPFADFYAPQDATFTVISSTEIHATVRDSAVTGPVRVTTPDGAVFFPFTVPGTYGISSISPRPAPEGTEITVIGTGFTSVDSVAWSPDAESGREQSFTVDDDTHIRFTFDRFDIVSTSGRVAVVRFTSDLTYSHDHLDVLINPYGLDIAPTTGSPGDVITIAGLSLGLVDDVFVTEYPAGVVELPAAFTIIDDNTVTFTVGTWPSGEYWVFARNAAGDGTAATRLTVIARPPTITSFTPTSGKPGDLIVITGTNLDTTTSVFGANGWFRVDSPTQLTAQVPLGATTGAVPVVNHDGSTESADPLIVIRPPRPAPVNDVYGDGSARAGGTPSSAVGDCMLLLGYVNNADGFTAEAVGGTLAPHWHVIASGTIDGYFWAVWAKLVTPDDIGYGAHIVPVTHIVGVTYCAAFITVWEDVFDVGTGVVGTGTGEVLTAPALTGGTAGVADGVPSIVPRPPLIDYGGSGPSGAQPDVVLEAGDWTAVGIDMQSDVYAAMFLLKATLDPDDATFETSVGAWYSADGYSLEQVVSPTPHGGSRVLQITFLGGPSNPANTPILGSETGGAHAVPVSSGQVVGVAGWFQADPGNAHVGGYSVIVTLRATRVNGTTAGTFDSAQVTLNESGWAEFTVGGTMPSGAKWLSIESQILGPGMTGMLTVGDRFYLSDVSLDAPPALRTAYDEQAAVTVRTAQVARARARKDRS